MMMSKLSSKLREKMTAANRAEYGEMADALSFVSPEKAADFEAERASLLSSLSADISMSFKDTKPHWGPLSPGCSACGQGQWSCLFINGKCNCRCFYCPTPQDDESVPTTNRISFEEPSDYTDYVRHFDFKGVSISGGEPLLTFDRTLRFIEAVRDSAPESLHLWMYTNGTLATPERLRQLRAAGLAEIRFDASAVAYDLTKVRMAADIIPIVTVEIPAVPEDLERLLSLLPEMQEAGVSHLNLHQLRLTPHNHTHLSKRNYTYLHGESVTVLESEFAALKVLERAARERMRLGVNYCSFVYKRRHQQAAARKRNALGVLKGYESVTEKGFVRSLSITGDPEKIGPQAEHLERIGADRQAWYLTGKKDRLFFHERLWSEMDFSAGFLNVSYYEAVLAPSVSYRCTFKEVRLNPSRKLFIEKRPLCLDMEVSDSGRNFLEKRALGGVEAGGGDISSVTDEIVDYECIRPGLQHYF